ncbi:MAG: DnaA/Hda family protein, partial [Pseudomonadota bacterium]
IDGWQDWQGAKMVLSGPPGAGKTHLTHVWAAASGAHILSAKDLDEKAVLDLSEGPVAIEDVDQIARDAAHQTTLFHLHNALQTARQPLLLTGTQSPSHWRMSLPDLQSRIDAAGHAALEAPDDRLLGAVVAKLFADRQLTPRPDVIPYLVTHMERSFDAARNIVARLDAASLVRQKPITRALAIDILHKAGQIDRA